MDKKLMEFLGKELPNSLCDIKESLEFLNLVLNDTMGKIIEKNTKTFQEKDFDKAMKCVENSKELNEISDKLKYFLED